MVGFVGFVGYVSYFSTEPQLGLLGFDMCRSSIAAGMFSEELDAAFFTCLFMMMQQKIRHFETFYFQFLCDPEPTQIFLPQRDAHKKALALAITIIG
jgi:hypothetical protein